jgi:hypothetical protein
VAELKEIVRLFLKICAKIMREKTRVRVAENKWLVTIAVHNMDELRAP